MSTLHQHSKYNDYLITVISKELDSVPKYRILEPNRSDRVAQLAEHWASIPKVVGSSPTVGRHIFQVFPVWIYIQSKITQASFSPEYITPTQQI